MDENEKLRIQTGAIVIIVGLLTVGIVAIVALFVAGATSNTAAVIGSITGVVGTVVGAFFGYHVGASGTSQAVAAQQAAVERANAFAFAADSTNPEAQNVLKQFGITK